MGLAIVTSVVIGLAVLSGQEPVIASNQLRVAQARALAEAGVERALWALDHPDDARGIPSVFTVAPAPYDGSELTTVASSSDPMGGFRVTVTNGAAPYERGIVAVGWVPNDSTPGPKAVQKIAAVALNPRLVLKDPPAAVSVRGALSIAGSVVVDGRADQTCGRRTGAVSVGGTLLQGVGPDVRGGTQDAATHNQITDAGGGALPSAAGDIVVDVSASVFDDFAPIQQDIDALRVLAKARGTYLRGNVSFDGSRRLPNGLVFVDAVPGTDAPPGASGASDPARVDIADGAAADPSGTWSGWLIVNGSVTVSGRVDMRGLVYARDSVSHLGSGTLSGALISRNNGDGSVSRIEPNGGSAVVMYNCADARSGGGMIPARWTLKSGSYREMSGT